MKTNVIAKLEIEGLHNWPAADQVFPEVGFLSYMHRHKWFRSQYIMMIEMLNLSCSREILKNG